MILLQMEQNYWIGATQVLSNDMSNILYFRVVPRTSVSDVIRVTCGRCNVVLSSADTCIFRPPIWHRCLKCHSAIISRFER